MGKSIKDKNPVLPAGDTVYHIPVLLQETLLGLHILPGGTYVDCTYGGGGHAGALLEQLNPQGKLIAFDQDEDALKNRDRQMAGLKDDRFIFIPQNFRHLGRFLKLHGISSIDGLIADLGISSHQIDQADRGFSTRFDAEMDMRMDRRQTLTAQHVLLTYTEERLHKIFEQYGEVTNAKTLARTIIQMRSSGSLRSIDGFKQALRSIVKGNPNRYFAQVFQALRIEVNDEFGALKEMLEQVPGLLKPGGRVAVITFHSLEDRLVKNFFRQGSFDPPEEHPFINSKKEPVFKVITRKPIRPQVEEIRKNPRAASAQLRIAEKL